MRNLKKHLINNSTPIKPLNIIVHAQNEINQNATDQESVAEHLATQTLMKGTKQMVEYVDLYKKSFSDMTALQLTIVDSAKSLTQKSKDYANQMGEALARIDKVLIKDFEVKLCLLERFVIASKEIAELEKSGMLKKISQSFNN